MLVTLSLLAFPAAAQSAGDCRIIVDKVIKDPAPAVYARCSVKGERLDTTKGLQLQTPDGNGGTTVRVSPLVEPRTTFRSAVSVTDSDLPSVLTVGVGAALDADGKRRRRRGDCKWEDYEVSDTIYRRSCSVTLEGNPTTTEVSVAAREDAKGRTVFTVTLDGQTFDADEEQVVDVAIQTADGESRGSGALRFIRSRAHTHLVFNDKERALYDGAAPDSPLWDGWQYDVLAADGKTSVISGKTDIEPDIVEGTVDVEVVLDRDAALEMALRGRADRESGRGQCGALHLGERRRRGHRAGCGAHRGSAVRARRIRDRRSPGQRVDHHLDRLQHRRQGGRRPIRGHRDRRGGQGRGLPRHHRRLPAQGRDLVATGPRQEAHQLAGVETAPRSCRARACPPTSGPTWSWPTARAR